jgi:enediyne polyketide synthase
MELWENALAGRRAFRRLPPERLRLEDYVALDTHDPDRGSATEAAVLEGWVFDRERFAVPGSTFRSTDPVHWLALEVAADALVDAGVSGGSGLPRSRTGVIVGNSLTGEFSRAAALRLRWPYVRRNVESVFAAVLPAESRGALMAALEHAYKRPFPPFDGDTLAGQLSNTIAGRICNHFDFNGGGFTVDGACASSLLAVITGCTALSTGDLDVALVGGVDLSLDPLELIGFARVGALTGSSMRVYDERADGFWPGEGCGFAMLMRLDDALAGGRRVYAVIRGWGFASDGSGGITRPEIGGQLLAIERAYHRAGLGADTVAYFEGHGTGTSVGDETELQALSAARADASRPAMVGSVKANIGHTKAAAGIAGLIKTCLALHAQIIPPATACDRPHRLLCGPDRRLQVAARGALWPPDRALRAGVSAMGFGGINTHVVLEGAYTVRRARLSAHETRLISSAQDAEILLVDGPNPETLTQALATLEAAAPGLSRAELGDLAAELQRRLDGRPLRAGVVASTPAELAAGLRCLRDALASGVTAMLDPAAGIFLGHPHHAPRISFLFSGQASPLNIAGGAWSRRFAEVARLYADAGLPVDADAVRTDVAQPAIVVASLAGLRVLTGLGIDAVRVVGHSLGELTALSWAGAFDADALVRIARHRGRLMAELGDPNGAMASIGADPETVGSLCDVGVRIASLNGPRQTVVAGPAEGVERTLGRARARRLAASRLPVTMAFHSPLVAAVAPALRAVLAGERFAPLEREVVSTVTGARLDPGTNLHELLCRQVTAPVEFLRALTAVGDDSDLLIEVGPGSVLARLAWDQLTTPAVSVDAGGTSIRPLLVAVAVAFVLGAPVRTGALFHDRFTRPFAFDRRPCYLANPCELAPARSEDDPPGTPLSVAPGPLSEADTPVLDVVRRLTAERVELPLDRVTGATRLLLDLRLNSIAVGQLFVEAARRLDLPVPLGLTDYATATVGQVAHALEESARMAVRGAEPAALPPGVQTWVRPFETVLVEHPRLPAMPLPAPGRWEVVAPDGHPLAVRLRSRMAGTAESGVVVCLPQRIDDGCVAMLLDGARAVLAMPGTPRLVVVAGDWGARGFARSLHREVPRVTTVVVHVPFDRPESVECIRAEAEAACEMGDVYYDAGGRRYEPVLRPLEPRGSADLALGAADVVLVTGGGKGIGAECAIGLAQETGARLLLLGRSDPAADQEVSDNLRRMGTLGLTVRYVTADVGDADATRGAIRAAEAEWGPVTAVVHAAGINEPCAVDRLDTEHVHRTLAPKLTGARNVLAAVDTDRLHFFVAFGSLISRAGMAGAAHYALANDWLTCFVEQSAPSHPSCRFLVVEWSVWSAVGMGVRLGRTDTLVREGITAISPDVGVAALLELLRRTTPVAVVVTGRFGDPSGLVDDVELPILRFLEQPRVHYPGVELVADAQLSLDTDPYLADHIVQGQPWLPAVVGLEAMAQVATGLAGSDASPIFEDVRFSHPVPVPAHGQIAVRVAALVRAPGLVDVVLRSQDTAFQVDHFRATCRWNHLEAHTILAATSDPSAMFAPARELYGRLFFQRGRFMRVLGYRRLWARECVAEIREPAQEPWFGRYLPQRLLLDDPGGRDAAVHAIQSCIPHRRILPLGVERLAVAAISAGRKVVHARERWQRDAVFCYDVTVVDEAGRQCESWDGLTLRAVGDGLGDDPWPTVLLGPYLERRLFDLVPAQVSVTVCESEATDRRARSESALRCLPQAPESICWRPDGRPQTPNGLEVSFSHCDTLTIAVTGKGPLACDVEAIACRPPTIWRDLLGETRFALADVVARTALEPFDCAATRVWVVNECLKKGGVPVDAPVTLADRYEDGWVAMRTGDQIVATVVIQLQSGSRTVFGILVADSANR